MRATTQRIHPRLAVAALGLGIALGAGAAQADDEGYGYYRILEGEATRYGVTDEGRNVSENEPLLEGDRVRVESGSRLEVVLPDFSRMRLGEYTDVDFERLRARDDRAEEFRLRLFEGDVQLTVVERPEEFVLSLEGADVYLLEGGSYRISGGVDYASVLVREGYAEVLTERGSAVARQGEEVVVEGVADPQVWVQDAGAADSLERWAEANERDAARSGRYVGDNLDYVASDLDDNGEWVEVGGSYAWRPLGSYDWQRPYHAGYWYDTPYGIHWVSQYRWGWLTAHYGYWDFDSHFGWVWYPGAIYSPAWVHWYWGPSYVGWVPSGFYYRHFGHFGYNYYGFVKHGWFGHHHGHHRHWTFCPRDRFGHRRDRFYYDGVDVVQRGGRSLEAGIITTDTRGVRRRNWNRVDETQQVLVRNASRTRGGLTYRHPEDLPDAVSYVTRTATTLPTEVGRVSRLGPTDQVERVRGAADARAAGGLVVPRGETATRGGPPERRMAVGDRPGEIRTGVDSRARTRVDSDRVSDRGSERRVILPGSPAVLGRGDDRAIGRGEGDRDSGNREVAARDRREVGRPDRDVERRGGWEIERRSIPRDSVDAREAPGRDSRSTSSRPSVTRRPTTSDRPSPSYDRGDRRGSGSSVSRPSAPTRRYDRPSSGRSSGDGSQGVSSRSRSSDSGSARSSGGSSRSSGASSSRGSSTRSRSDDD